MSSIEVVDALGAPKRATGDGIVVVDPATMLPKAPAPPPGPVQLLDAAGEAIRPELPPLPGCDFTWDRTPPPAWQAELDRTFPRSDRLSWLLVGWYAADEVLDGQRIKVDPVQRWVIWQMTPAAAVPPLIRDYLEGPPPHPKHNPIPVCREQWDLFRSTGCYAQAYWIIQGERGGHKRRFTDVEAKVLNARGLPTHPPVPGSLPYAPFDRRVLDKLLELDRARFWNRGIELDERKPEDLDAEHREAAEAARGWLFNWLESQVDAAYDSVSTLVSPLEIPTSSDAPFLDRDRARAELIRAD